jgi:hypothetical protein
MLKVSTKVSDAVNKEVGRRVKERYPDGKKLMYQSPDDWKPNCSFVNCYDGAQEKFVVLSDTAKPSLTFISALGIIRIN